MAKLPLRKSTSKAPPPFSSRRSRRLSSPNSLNTTLLHPPSPPMLTHKSHQPTISGGIAKHKRSKTKPLSRSQRLRKERGIEKAERIIDRTSHKVEKSVGRLGKRRGRRREWEDVNADAVGKRRKALIVLGSGEGMEGMHADNTGEEVGDGEGKKEKENLVEEGASSAGEGDELDRAIRAAPVQKDLMIGREGTTGGGDIDEVLEEL